MLKKLFLRRSPYIIGYLFLFLSGIILYQYSEKFFTGYIIGCIVCPIIIEYFVYKRNQKKEEYEKIAYWKSEKVVA